ncbi:MAG: hypothetical protein EOS58_30730 [Mesorhizobium sp.]|nr:MAG: hypothetical protein EOS58_30730 [Mesorhizobium sp.]
METTPDIVLEPTAWRTRLTPSVRLVVVAAVYAGTAAVLFPTSFAASFGGIRLLMFYLLLPILMLLGLAFAGIIQQPGSPLGYVRAKIRSRGIGAMTTIGVFTLCLGAFTTYKHEFSSLVGFFADPLFARLDATIHFGDPWRWTRALPVPGFFDRMLYFLYSQLWLALVAGIIVFAAWMEDAATRLRYFTALLSTAILLGVVARLAGSSAGPIFYDRLFGGDRFADLMSALKTSDSGPETLQIADYLYASYASNETVVGSGISAMPSFHVAMVTLNALFLWSLNRRVGSIAWLYAGLILFGSVYAGWHYAIDGYVSIATVLMIWRWTRRRYVAPGDHRNDTATIASKPALDVAWTA